MSQNSTIRTRSYVTAVLLCGLAVVGFAASQYKTQNAAHFAAILCAAAVASRLSVKIPRVTASLSLDVPFVVLAAVQMGITAAVAVAAVATFIQCLKSEFKKGDATKIAFNVAALSISAAWAARVLEVPSLHNAGLRMAVAGAILLAANSVIVAIVVALDSDASIVKVLYELLVWSFPAYVLSAGIASMVAASQVVVG